MGAALELLPGLTKVSTSQRTLWPELRLLSRVENIQLPQEFVGAALKPPPGLEPLLRGF